MNKMYVIYVFGSRSSVVGPYTTDQERINAARDLVADEMTGFWVKGQVLRLDIDLDGVPNVQEFLIDEIDEDPRRLDEENLNEYSNSSTQY